MKDQRNLEMTMTLHVPLNSTYLQLKKLTCHFSFLQGIANLTAHESTKLCV